MFFPVMHISRDLYNKTYNDINNEENNSSQQLRTCYVPGAVLVNVHDLFKAQHNQVKKVFFISCPLYKRIH